MDLRQMRYFLKVAEELNITVAARSLHVSQPTLSREIMNLEAECGKQLLVRGSRRIELTGDGQLLRRRAREIVQLADQLDDEFRSLGNEDVRGQVILSVGEFESFRILARAARQLRDKQPHISFQIHSSDGDIAEERLSKGISDFALLLNSRELSRMNTLPLPPGELWGVYAPEDSPISSLEEITPPQLKELPLLIIKRPGLVSLFRQWIGTDTDQLNIAATFNLIFNARLLMLEGLGYIFAISGLIDTSPGSDTVFIPLSPTLRDQTCLVWRKDRTLSPAAQLFLREVRDEIARECQQNAADQISEEMMQNHTY